jgi:rRNA maturation endonuclease Nob1
MKEKKYVIVKKEHDRGMEEWWCTWFECPNCKPQFPSIYINFNFCPMCGIELKWSKDLRK